MEMSVSRDISRPAAEVFEFFADASNNPQWQAGMQSCEWTSQPPVGVGSTYEQHARFMGRDIHSSFLVTVFEDGQLIEIETVKSTFPIKVIRRVEPTGPSSCLVSAQISGGPQGFLKLFDGVLSRTARKSIERDYDLLVQLLETSASTGSTENSPSE